MVYKFRAEPVLENLFLSFLALVFVATLLGGCGGDGSQDPIPLSFTVTRRDDSVRAARQALAAMSPGATIARLAAVAGSDAATIQLSFGGIDVRYNGVTNRVMPGSAYFVNDASEVEDFELSALHVLQTSPSETYVQESAVIVPVVDAGSPLRIALLGAGSDPRLSRSSIQWNGVNYLGGGRIELVVDAEIQSVVTGDAVVTTGTPSPTTTIAGMIRANVTTTTVDAPCTLSAVVTPLVIDSWGVPNDRTAVLTAACSGGLEVDAFTLNGVLESAVNGEAELELPGYDDSFIAIVYARNPATGETNAYFYWLSTDGSTYAAAPTGTATPTPTPTPSPAPTGTISASLPGGEAANPLWIDFTSFSGGSESKTVLMTNTGSGPVALGAAPDLEMIFGAPEVPFTVTSDCAQRTLQPGESCSVSVTFTLPSPASSSYWASYNWVSVDGQETTIYLMADTTTVQ